MSGDFFLQSQFLAFELLDRHFVWRRAGHFLMQSVFQPGMFCLKRGDVGRFHLALLFCKRERLVFADEPLDTHTTIVGAPCEVRILA